MPVDDIPGWFMERKYNFILADDHPLFRKALRGLIEAYDFAGEVFEARNGAEVINLLAHEKIDLIFLDYSMPELNGYDTAKLIFQNNADARVVVLTQYDEIPVILNFFKVGVKGFLTKSADESEIRGTIDAVLKGNYSYHSRFDASISRWLADGLAKKNVSSIKFSERDMQLVIHMSKGKTTHDISTIMGLSIRSVETYRYQLMKSLDVKNNLELLNYVYRNGIV